MFLTFIMQKPYSTQRFLLFYIFTKVVMFFIKHQLQRIILLSNLFLQTLSFYFTSNIKLFLIFQLFFHLHLKKIPKLYFIEENDKFNDINQLIIIESQRLYKKIRIGWLNVLIIVDYYITAIRSLNFELQIITFLLLQNLTIPEVYISINKTFLH